MYYSSANEPQHRSPPPLINKTLQPFVPGVMRGVRGDPQETEFRNLVVGDTFRMDSYEVNPIERQMILKKIAPSVTSPNAEVVRTYRAKENPVGQKWNVDALCPCIKATVV
jgi:hypothetical protein